MVFAASDEKARLTTRGTLAARRRSSCPSLPSFPTFEMFQRVAKNANGENCYTVLLSSRLKLNLESCCFLPRWMQIQRIETKITPRRVFLIFTLSIISFLIIRLGLLNFTFSIIRLILFNHHWIKSSFNHCFTNFVRRYLLSSLSISPLFVLYLIKFYSFDNKK